MAFRGNASALAQSVSDALTNHIAQQTNVHGIVSSAQLATGIGGGPDLYFSAGNSGAAKTFDLINGNVQEVTLTANSTFTFTNTAVTMDASHAYSWRLSVLQDATGGRTVTWPASVTWLSGNPSPNPVASSKTDFIFYTKDAGTTWYGVQVNTAVAPLFSNFVTWAGDLSPWQATPTAITANQAILMRCPILTAGVMHNLSLGVATNSGNFDAGIYKWTSGTTITRQFSLGSTSMAALIADWNDVSANPGVTVNFGDDIWLAFACDNAVATFYRKTYNANALSSLPSTFNANGSAQLCASKATSFPLPASFDTTTLNDSNPFAMCARIT